LVGLLSVLALAALGARAWMDLRQGLRDTERMSVAINHGFQTIHELGFHVGEARRMALSATATQDPAEQLRFADRSREAGAEVEDLLDDLRSSPVSLDDVGQAWAEYRHARDGLLDRLPSPAPGRDPGLSPGVGSPEFQRLEDRLTEMSLAYSRYATQRADSIDTEINRALGEGLLLWMMALVGIVSAIAYHHRKVVTAQALQAAECVAIARSEFVAMISHEIRTPLNVLTGMTSLLQDSPLNAGQREWVAAGRAASAAVLSVVNNVLESARLDAGQLAIDPQPVSIHGIVDTSIEMVSLAARQKRLVLSRTVDASVPPIVQVDGTRLRQVLTNLLGNAVKFTRAGTVTLRADAVRLEGTSDVLLRFAVADTGIGIAPDRLPGLFAPFSQGDASTHRLFGGSGLGLSICKRLAQVLGGDLQAESRAGVGSTFTFTCRAKILTSEQDDTAREGPGNADREENLRLPDDLGRTHPLRVLVVDDDEASRRVAADLLARFGYHADVASDGASTIEAVRSTPYDLVFMDVQMPGLDGCETTRRLRGLTTAGSMPRFVALTANVTDVDRARSREAGMDDYLTKPICLDEMRRVLVSTARGTTASCRDSAPAGR
jgi:signal transduction histidine kinase/ActR/RegA family two-component response regulator